MREKEYIETLPLWARKKNSLESIAMFLSRLHPSLPPVIHVAGTNGKGSVCAYLSHILLQAGFHTGTFVSPHLVSVNERILLDMVPVGEEDFEQASCRVRTLAKVLEKEGLHPPTYFEHLFYMAMEVFSKKKPDFVILETGMGGRLDATNVCRPILTIITSIGLDHTQYLGNTIEKIAWEKAGIIKKNVPLIYADKDKRADEVVCSRARELGAALFLLSKEAGRFSFDFLTAPYQREDAVLAAVAGEILLPPKKAGEAILSGIQNTKWSGRMEEIREDVFVDGAHNPPGLLAFLQGAKGICQSRNKKMKVLLSLSKDKAGKEMVSILAGEALLEALYLVQMENPRGMDLKELQGLFQGQSPRCRPAACFLGVPKAFALACREKKEDEILFCTGSLYLAGEILGGLDD